MPVPASINDLSTTAVSNYPAGTENPFPDSAKYMRAHAAFIAQLRDGKLNASAVSAFILTLLDDANAAAARATLGAAAISDIPKRYITGQWVLTPDTTTPSGCVIPNGGTIGNASSGATTRANADTSDLFAFYWRLTNNTDYPIQDSAGAVTTRGASAAADFAANKRFPLPDIQDGDALIAAVSSSVLTRSVGEVLAHTHSVTDPGHAHSYTASQIVGGTQGAGGNASRPELTTWATASATTGISIGSTGGTKNLASGLFTRVYVAL